jgi:hypothetical protein
MAVISNGFIASTKSEAGPRSPVGLSPSSRVSSSAEADLAFTTSKNPGDRVSSTTRCCASEDGSAVARKKTARRTAEPMIRMVIFTHQSIGAATPTCTSASRRITAARSCVQNLLQIESWLRCWPLRATRGVVHGARWWVQTAAADRKAQSCYEGFRERLLPRWHESARDPRTGPGPQGPARRARKARQAPPARARKAGRRRARRPRRW